MDTRTILADLEAELERITHAIAALEALDVTAPASSIATTPATKSAARQVRGSRRSISAAGRRSISEEATARWAVRRKQVEKPTPNKTGAHKPMVRGDEGAAVSAYQAPLGCTEEGSEGFLGVLDL